MERGHGPYTKERVCGKGEAVELMRFLPKSNCLRNNVFYVVAGQ